MPGWQRCIASKPLFGGVGVSSFVTYVLFGGEVLYFSKMKSRLSANVYRYFRAARMRQFSLPVNRFRIVLSRYPKLRNSSQVYPPRSHHNSASKRARKRKRRSHPRNSHLNGRQLIDALLVLASKTKRTEVPKFLYRTCGDVPCCEQRLADK